MGNILLEEQLKRANQVHLSFPTYHYREACTYSVDQPPLRSPQYFQLNTKSTVVSPVVFKHSGKSEGFVQGFEFIITNSTVKDCNTPMQMTSFKKCLPFHWKYSSSYLPQLTLQDLHALVFHFLSLWKE